jgi:hypothetical protein
VGKLEPGVPQDRDGPFSTELFERYQRSERALVAALAEMYVQGVSTRKLKAITEDLCGHSFSASSISAHFCSGLNCRLCPDPVKKMDLRHKPRLAHRSKHQRGQRCQDKAHTLTPCEERPSPDG